jgi:hypothetical protein
VASLTALFTALLKAVPALESLLRAALAERDRALAAQAAGRKTAKDAAVDAAIDPVPPA